ncbi:MAG: hypothetical protein DWI27_00220 [Planctomycetota bacterium]|nr:MAG: hypothetical protein DWI27_00220 [Planctomycetota bacterium]
MPPSRGRAAFGMSASGVRPDAESRSRSRAQDRTEQSLRGFFTSLTAEVRAGIRFVCSDMWRQYLNVIAEQIPAALHVLDRFHIMRNMNTALDEVRRAEVAQLRRDGYEPILTKARWCLLKRPENLTEHQEIRFFGEFRGRFGGFRTGDGLDWGDGNTCHPLRPTAGDRRLLMG